MLPCILITITATLATLLAIRIARNIYISWLFDHHGREIGVDIADEIMSSFRQGEADRQADIDADNY